MSIDPKLKARMDRGNEMLKVLERESDRGKACVADALIDELVKELFTKRLIAGSETDGVLSDGQALGNHGLRLKLAYLHGWIGSQTRDEARRIHRIRNKMAHRLEVDSFDHHDVRDLVDGMTTLAQAIIEVKGQLKRVKMPRRADKFLWAAMWVVQSLWWHVDRAQQAAIAEDPEVIRLPHPDHS